ncbi:MAG: hypothetical protein JO285_09000 [Kutzneria sp.]|nr:hypothetical protein [Kutzneria sp.]
MPQPAEPDPRVNDTPAASRSRAQPPPAPGGHHEPATPSVEDHRTDLNRPALKLRRLGSDLWLAAGPVLLRSLRWAVSPLVGIMIAGRELHDWTRWTEQRAAVAELSAEQRAARGKALAEESRRRWKTVRHAGYTLFGAILIGHVWALAAHASAIEAAVWIGLAVALLATASWVGRPRRVPAGRDATGAVPEIAWHGGLGERQLAVSLKEAFDLVKVSPLKVESVRVYGAFGWIATVRTHATITRDHVETLEKVLDRREGSVLLSRGSKGQSAAQVRLTIVDRDPLEPATPPSVVIRPARSVSITQPADVGRGVHGHGHPISLPLDRHVGLVGATGSGKSIGGLWTLLDHLTCCFDNVTHGIDLSGKATLRLWSPLLGTVTDSPRRALSLLEDALRYCIARARLLNEATFLPGVHGPQLSLVIDEVSAVADDPYGRWLLEQIARKGRGSAVRLLLAGQTARNADLGSRPVLDALDVRIALRCHRDDVSVLFGRGAAERGWAADRIDGAGKFYAHVLDGGDQAPELGRFPRWDDEGRAVTSRVEARTGQVPMTLDMPTLDAAAAVDLREFAEVRKYYGDLTEVRAASATGHGDGGQDRRRQQVELLRQLKTLADANGGKIKVGDAAGTLGQPGLDAQRLGEILTELGAPTVRTSHRGENGRFVVADRVAEVLTNLQQRL